MLSYFAKILKSFEYQSVLKVYYLTKNRQKWANLAKIRKNANCWLSALYILFISLVFTTLYRVWVLQIPCDSMICKGFLFYKGYLKFCLMLMNRRWNCWIELWGLWIRFFFVCYNRLLGLHFTQTGDEVAEKTCYKFGVRGSKVVILGEVGWEVIKLFIPCKIRID